MKAETPKSYEQARAELNALVEALEKPDADLSGIAAQVKRGAFLTAYCRDYLRGALDEATKIYDDARS